ncbi:putative Kinase [Quillaja saponaria]|uniref:Kinase n=1 Tax=Quillaja saponaria TaxID=32244 RepID=A0AAD7LHY3_QUISA|nr:putative Kinase [Quillaja saponaria]
MLLIKLATFSQLCNLCCFLFCLLQFFAPFAYPLSFNIPSFESNATDIAYEGDAVASFQGIELNLDDLFRVGQATYVEPLHVWDSSSGNLTDFTCQFSFSVDRVNGSDGFAFFLAPVGFQIPPNSAAGHLGLFNYTTRAGVPGNPLVFVEFDTYPNEGFDPPVTHVGINNNTISSLTYARWDVDMNITTALITYNSTTENISVWWSKAGEPLSMGNSSLSYHIDLRKALPEYVTMGFTGATGLGSELHTIRSWQFSSTMNSKEVTLSRKKQSSKTLVIVVATVSSFVLVVIGVSMSWFSVKKWKRNNHISNEFGDTSSSFDFDLERGAFPRRFYYQELVEATNGFADDRRLGQGGSGQVYKGTLSELGRLVAVKRIYVESEHSQKISINEVKIISRLIHRNLVQFIGWCQEKREFLLVYEYMPNGSLDTHLFGNKRTLPWNVRYKIALDLASALHYLHEDAEQCVLHRDIKSANVLLDSDFSTKLGDFGVAKLVDPQLRTQRTGVVGTYGYLAPEYFSHGRASKESDMFSFGVVALEIACGRRTLEDGGYHVSLVRWVWELYISGNILNAADQRLNMDFVESEMRRLLIVGLWCTNPNDMERPKAGQVMKVLQLEAPLPELPFDMHGSDATERQTQGQVDPIQSPLITTSLDHGGR